MNPSEYALESWQTMLLTMAYMGYLCFVMFGGLRRRKVKAPQYIVMSILMIYGVIRLFDGFYGTAAVINLALITGIALVKGIYLGHKKIVECVEGVYYMRHEKTYIVIWLMFFLGKFVMTGGLKFVTGEEIPVWHMVYYLCLYYMIRTITVFVTHPQLAEQQRKAVADKFSAKKV